MKDVVVNIPQQFLAIAYDGIKQLGIPQGDIVWTTDIGSFSTDGIILSATTGTGTISVTAAGITVSDGITVHTTPFIMYNLNGGTGIERPLELATLGGTATIQKRLDLVKSGKKFLGWNTSASGDGVHYSAGQTVTVTGALVLYAEWTDAVAGVPDNFSLYYTFTNHSVFPKDYYSTYLYLDVVDAFGQSNPLEDMTGNSVQITETNIPTGDITIQVSNGGNYQYAYLYIDTIATEGTFSFTLKFNDYEKVFTFDTYAQVPSGINFDWSFGSTLRTYQTYSITPTIPDQYGIDIVSPSVLSLISVIADVGGINQVGRDYFYRPYLTTTADRIVASISTFSYEQSFSMVQMELDHMVISSTTDLAISSPTDVSSYGVSYTLNWWGDFLYLSPTTVPLDETRVFAWATDRDGSFLDSSATNTNYTASPTSGTDNITASFGAVSVSKAINVYVPIISDYWMYNQQKSLTMLPSVKENLYLDLIDQYGMGQNLATYISSVVPTGDASVTGNYSYLYYTAPSTAGSYSIDIASLFSLPVSVVFPTAPTVTPATYAPLGRLGTPISFLHNSDDDFYEVSLPYPVKFNGISHGSLFVGSNSYVTFGAGSTAYRPIGTTVPNLSKIIVNSRDRQTTDVYSWQTSSEWSIRYEGEDWDSHPIVWELRGNVSSPDTIILTIVSIAADVAELWQLPANTGAYLLDGTKYSHFGGAGTAWSITSF